MPTFGGGGFQFPVQAPATGPAPSMGTFGAMAPNAPALAQQAPVGGPPTGGVPPTAGLEDLLGSLLGGGAPAVAPPAASAPPPPSIPVPIGQPTPMRPVTPVFTDPGENFPQAFRAESGRWPTALDYADRTWTVDFTRRTGRLPTKLEFMMQTQAPRPTDGEPEFEEVPVA